MKKKLLTLVMAAAVFCSMGMSALAADCAVTFTADNKLEYSGTLGTEEQGVVLGNFDQVAPGDSITQTITLKNDNSLSVDFYMNAETLTALEEAVAQGQTANGAAYAVKLEAGDTVVYDSNVGGYSASQQADNAGLKRMNDALKDYIMVGTLSKGESKEIRMTIDFDGEAMDNTTGGVDYSNTLGKIAFNFMVSYEEPEAPVIIYKEVTQEEEPTVITKIVDQIIPLAPKTGDVAMIGIAAAVLVIGVVLIVIAGRKKNKEDKS